MTFNMLEGFDAIYYLYFFLPALVLISGLLQLYKIIFRPSVIWICTKLGWCAHVRYWYSFYSSSYLVYHDDMVSHSVTWHAKLGPIGQDMTVRLARVSLLGSLAKIFLHTCEPCLIENPLENHSIWRASSILELVHSDICGSMNVMA